MLEAVIIILLTTLTVVQSFRKWGWLDTYEAHRTKKWLPSGGCDLCMSFWLSMPVAGVYYALSIFGSEWLLIPFCCAGLINYIERN